VSEAATAEQRRVEALAAAAVERAAAVKVAVAAATKKATKAATKACAKVIAEAKAAKLQAEVAGLRGNQAMSDVLAGVDADIKATVTERLKVYARAKAKSEKKYKAALEKHDAVHKARTAKLIAYSSEEQRRQTMEQRKVHDDEVAKIQSEHAAKVDQLRNDTIEKLASSGGGLGVARLLLTGNELAQVESITAVEQMGASAATVEHMGTRRSTDMAKVGVLLTRAVERTVKAGAPDPEGVAKAVASDEQAPRGGRRLGRATRRWASSRTRSRRRCYLGMPPRPSRF